MSEFYILRKSCFQPFISLLLILGFIFPPVNPVSARQNTPPPPEPASLSPEQDETAAEEEGPVEIPIALETEQLSDGESAAVQLQEQSTVEPPVDSQPETTVDLQVETPQESTVEPLAETQADQETNPADKDQNGNQQPIKEIPEDLLATESSVEDGISAVVEMLSDNDLTILGEDGAPLSLASEEAAEILTGADPYFIADGIIYGWTNAGTPENPSCSATVTEGYCSFSANPISDAIASPLYAGQRLTIEDGDYSSDDVIIAKPVDLNPRVNLQVRSITLGDEAIITWSSSDGAQNYLTASNIFIEPGASIQDGLEMVKPGGTINLSAGVFIQDDEVEINKPVTIRGAGSSETTVTPHSSCSRCSYYFIVKADDVKIQNLTLDGQYRVETGIMIDNNNRLEVSDSVIKKIFRNGILVSDFGPGLGGDSDTIATATYNIHDNYFLDILAGGATNDGYGIKISDNAGSPTDHLIANNIFTQANRAVWIGSSSVMVEGNNFYANKYGVNVEDLNTGNEVLIRNNRFFGNTTKGVRYNPGSSGDPVVDASENWWGCNTGPNSTGCDGFISTKVNKIKADSYLKLDLTVNPADIAIYESAILEPIMYSSADSTHSPLEGLSWFTPVPMVSLSGPEFGLLNGNVFTAAGIGIQDFLIMFDNESAAAQVAIKGIHCEPGFNDADGNNTCEATQCPAGEFDADSDGQCELTECPPGTFDANSDGVCEAISCEDGDPTTTDQLNLDGSCSHTLISCDDGDPTTIDQLNPDGSCSNTLISCDDGDPTTIDQLNPDGNCSHSLISCDDGDPTTIDQLNPDGSCSNTLISCDDGDPTTIDQLNPDGNCSHSLISCDDGDPTTIDQLNPDGSCSNTLISCDDSDPTTIDQLNPDGSCSHSLISCDDGDPTTIDQLNPDGSCSNTLISCDDGDPTTTDKLNPDGSCSNNLISCDDGDPTTIDQLNPDGSCSNTLISCDDGDPTTTDQLNLDGSCSHTLISCDDGDPTTTDQLNQDGSCSHTLISCDDGDPTTIDQLNPDGSCSNTLISCDDGDPTTIDQLNPDGSCSNTLISCDDGDPTTTDKLNPDGSCSNNLISCDDGDPATTDQLNPDGSCSNTLISCDDDDPTTTDELNPDGSCSNTLISCDDGDPTTIDELNPDGSCLNTKKVCDDGLAMTENILNPDGTCSFPVIVCDDGLATTQNILNPDGTCSFPIIVCDDGLATTQNILNPDGTCSFPLIVCDDGLATTQNILNPDGTCSFPVIVCDDGLATTQNNLNPDGTCSFPVIVCDDGLATTQNILNPDGSCTFPVKSCDDGKPETNDILNADGTCSNNPVICPPGFSDSDRNGTCEMNPSLADDSGEPGDEVINFYKELFGVIPVTGGLINLDAVQPQEIPLPGGGALVFSNPLPGFQVGLQQESELSLPAGLNAGTTFGYGITLNLVKDETSIQVLPEPVTYTLKLQIPAELQNQQMVLLFWDASLNGGLGGWVEIFVFDSSNIEAGIVSESQNMDQRVLSIEWVNEEIFEIKLNFAGLFVLAGKQS